MRMLVVGGSAIGLNPHAHVVAEVAIAGVPVHFAVLERPDREFDPDAPENHGMVLVRTRAFSLNFRDKALILGWARRMRPTQYFAIGSELAAEVVACGAGVTRVAVGDRVILNCEYPQRNGEHRPKPGLPTNQASVELAVFPEHKLLPIPPTMSDAEGAAFTIGAQTAYSMVRRIAPVPGETVAVTAARSNTSLFALLALRERGARICALTTSARDHDRLRALGADEVIRVDPSLDRFADDPNVLRAAKAGNGFDGVVDPFLDIHLTRLVDLLAFGARYTSCGIYHQYTALTGRDVQRSGLSSSKVVVALMMRNVNLVANCLGEEADLRRALADHAEGRLQVPIDSVHAEDGMAAFLERSYNDPDRFGKVILRYS